MGGTHGDGRAARERAAQAAFDQREALVEVIKVKIARINAERGGEPASLAASVTAALHAQMQLLEIVGQRITVLEDEILRLRPGQGGAESGKDEEPPR
jgi:hypothetical protein